MTTTLPTAPDDAKALSYGTGMSQRYQVRRVAFGDQYSQRAQKGLNTKPQSWKLVWSNLADADAESLRTFFEGLGGTGLLTWTPFNQTTALNWTANDFDSKPVGYQRTDCSVTLTQEFDL